MNVLVRNVVVAAAAVTTVVAAYHFYSNSDLTDSDAEFAVPGTETLPAVVPESEPTNETSGSAQVHETRTKYAVPEDIPVTIKFSSGEEVDVTLRHFWPDETPVEIKPRLADIYDELVAYAENGDGASARYLNRALRSCRSAFRDKDSKDEAIAKLRATGEISYPEGAEFPDQHVPPGRDIGQFIEVMEEQFVACEGVSDEQIDHAEYWLDEAIRAGDFLATRDHAAEVGVHTAYGFQVQQKLWDQGHISAVNGLGMAYRKGIPGENDGQPDYVKSYAYGYATFKLFEAALEQANSPQAHNRLRSFENSLSGKGAYLTPEQQGAAIELAAEILRENKNCCLGVWSM